MKLLNLTALASLFTLIACSSHTLPHSNEHENAWFIHKGSMGSSYPIYCKANPTATGAKPVCYEADIK